MEIKDESKAIMGISSSAPSTSSELTFSDSESSKTELSTENNNVTNACAVVRSLFIL